MEINSDELNTVSIRKLLSMYLGRYDVQKKK